MTSNDLERRSVRAKHFLPDLHNYARMTEFGTIIQVREKHNNGSDMPDFKGRIGTSDPKIFGSLHTPKRFDKVWYDNNVWSGVFLRRGPSYAPVPSGGAQAFTPAPPLLYMHAQCEKQEPIFA